MDHQQFDRTFRRAGFGLAAFWILSMILGLTVVGVSIWAIVAIVGHITS